MKKLFAVVLALGMLFLSACSKTQTIEEQVIGEKNAVSQTELKSESETQKAPEELKENSMTPDSVESEPELTPKSVEEYVVENKEASPSQTAAPEPTPSQAEPEEERQITVPITFEFVDEDDVPATEEPAQPTTPVVTPAPEPDQEKSDAEEPVVPPVVEPEPNPIPEPIPEPEPAFDISYWVSFAKSYGQQAGLSYDSQATDCWDNPILASPNSIYLERDITSRLSRYVREGMTAFCVWSELLPDGRYNIYIGYA